ncbi:MAG: hypothetical protein PHP39_00900 [Oscillospiraceae bacterium]|nr:hypothetical protein [Oscillospiraceae bacterium]
MHTKKKIRIVIFAAVLIVVCTVIGIFLIKEKSKMNLWGDWFSQDNVQITLTWIDPKGVQQVRSTSDVEQVMNISTAFQAISNPQKILFPPDEASSGLIVYRLNVAGENRTILYAISNNYIFIADERSPKYMTVWKVMPEQSEDLIQIVRDNTE